MYNDDEFIHDKTYEQFKHNNIRHTISEPYHPRVCGLGKRLVHNLKKSLRASKTDQSSLTTPSYVKCPKNRGITARQIACNGSRTGSPI